MYEVKPHFPQKEQHYRHGNNWEVKSTYWEIQKDEKNRERKERTPKYKVNNKINKMQA